jgi:hypothetical protein
MYLVSYLENEAVIEASLCGRVSADEVRLFGEELADAIEVFGPCSVMLDFSRALDMDAEAQSRLNALKDACLKAGAKKIVSLPWNEFDVRRNPPYRPDHILDGLEDLVPDPESAHFSAIVASVSEAA